MQKIPLWGKIVGGCSILLVLGLFVLGGCVAIVALTSDPEPTPTTSPETSEPVEPETEEPTETETETETTVPEPTTSSSSLVNTCLPDQDQAMAEVVASITSADVTIYTDQVYMVAEDDNLNGFYVVAGSDAGTIIIYTSTNVNGEPMSYAANDTAYDYTALYFPEDLGAPEIDKESETYKVAEGCVS